MGSLEFGVNNTIFGAFSKLGVFVMIGENIAFVLAKDPIAKALSRVAVGELHSFLAFICPANVPVHNLAYLHC
ncbi:hypothetical protein V6N11_067528 [Hibiscus sabdariffa]|uniref:Uncharacterized protein n=1 Tax=Hibiscus sabdariffa TaxID=183260 RepID=A0ABR2SR49_9ROSI